MSIAFDAYEDVPGGPDGFGGGGDDDLGGFEHAHEMDMDDGGFQFDLGLEGNEEVGEIGVREKTPKASQASQARKKQKVAEEEGEEESVVGYLDEEAVGGVSGGPLAVFDVVGGGGATTASQAQTQAQTQSLGATEEDDQSGPTRTKWSKNTVKALGVLKEELGGADENKSMEFGKVAEKVSFFRFFSSSLGSSTAYSSRAQATRRAAASFFFELLVLSTRDCVMIEQPEAYGQIEVTARDKLWSVVEDVEAQ
jgi:cohesin complex subunit SCC1